MLSLDYFIILQKEYILAELRKKIHFKLADRKYWERVSLYKKERINTIAFKGNLLSIFSDQKTFEDIKFSIYGSSGIPNFLYKNEIEREILYRKDLYGYYAKRSHVRCEIAELGIVVGTVIFTDLIKQQVVVVFKDKKYLVSFKNATRIF